jgi:WD40 repeat protein
MSESEAVHGALIPNKGGAVRPDIETERRQELSPDRLREMFQVHGAHVAAVTSVALSASGDVLASGSDDKTVKVWNARTGSLLHSLVRHANQVNSLALSALGEVLAKLADLWIELLSSGMPAQGGSCTR